MEEIEGDGEACLADNVSEKQARESPSESREKESLL